MTAVAPGANIARGKQRDRWCVQARPARRGEEAARGHGAQGSAGARGACLASAPGAWRARVYIAFIIMVVSCAVLVVL